MSIEKKKEIESAIKAFASGNHTKNALALFESLGYATDRQAPLQKPTKEQFKETFIQGYHRFNESKAYFDDWIYVDLLFQLTKDEASRHTSLFDTKKVDNTIIETYLFFVIELKRNAYSRTELSNITREVNRLFPMPVMVLFKIGSHLTLSIINRRLHKKDEGKDVLEKVTLIKEILIEKPHRAHVEILTDLSFDQLLSKHQFTNFVELHNAWQATLDIKELNNRFFQELANWYFWALQHVDFPNDRNLDKEKNLQINIIRLITRLIFVWFLKEKRLVSDNLFNSLFIKSKLKSFDPEGDKAKTYYNAILQNLFFATLNQKMTERGFVKDGDFNTNREQHGIKNKYRYSKHFSISEKEVIELFKDIPFLNGGLFDCLDKNNDETGKHEYVDGFSREEKKTAKIPDMLFFSKKRVIDLSEGYGYKRSKEECRGLLEIFNDYKFTIEENTPIEEEIALDPELLGKVFENLLAYYTPETSTTARKQTGSFYTPREIVEYMVDESLISYLKTQMLEEHPTWMQLGNLQSDNYGDAGRKGQLPIEQKLNGRNWLGKESLLEANLRQLLSYTDEKHLFISEADVQELIYAIDHIKILDPACGSGAFPMGILHKLVYVLGKLDKDNVRWRELQKRKAQVEIDGALDESDKKEREKKLIDINDSFEDNASDYGRKLYLIENCVYGVDIQSIAVQISKLRFFISLVVDQREKYGVNNRGIRPLPNLETKFIAANTLIGLDKPVGLDLRNDVIKSLELELNENRHKHFNAKTRRDKIVCQKADKSIRKKIADQIRKDYSDYEQSINRQIEKYQNDLKLSHSAKIREAEKLKYEKARADVENKIKKLKQSLLNKSGIDLTATNIASFDIYDQNSSANWFEPEWMFGKELAQGFDVVIGNPPYVSYYSNSGSSLTNEEREYFLNNYDSVVKSNDRINSMNLMVERGIRLLKDKGHLSFITNKTISVLPSYIEIRRYILGRTRIEYLVTNLDPFEAIVDCIVIGLRKEVSTNYKLKWLRGRTDVFETKDVSPFYLNAKLELHYSSNQNIIDLIESANNKLEDLIIINRGVNIGGCFDSFLSPTKKSTAYWKYLSGTRNIDRYYFEWFENDGYMRFDLNLERELRENGETLVLGNPDRYKKERLFIPESGQYLMAAYCNEDYYSAYGIMVGTSVGPNHSIKYACALLNSKLLTFYAIQKEILRKGKKATPHVGVKGLDNLPIHFCGNKVEKIICIIVDYIMLSKSFNPHSFSMFFERLIDAIVYELYLGQVIQSAGCEVLKHLYGIIELKEDWSTDKKLKTIEKVYNEFISSNHPVSIAMFRMDTIEEIRIIEGKQ
jgi:hypothetical protein